MDLIHFMGQWLAKVLQLEGNVFPVITSSYRLGSPIKSENFPDMWL